MQKLQRINEHALQGIKGCILALGIVGIIQSRFYHFNVPVAEFVPDEIINLLNGNAQVIIFHVFSYVFYQSVALGQNPLVNGL